MSENEIPESVRPKPDDVGYDLDRALSAVVGVRAEIPDDAFTASVLGTERAGNGVVIREDGLVLTIGYLITEAETVWLRTNDGQAAPAHVMAYDQGTGFGLLQALARLRVTPLTIGSAAGIEVDDDVVVAGFGGRAGSLRATIAAKREFAGYWEYVLDEALFTLPAHPNWGGTACIAPDGRLAGIGSLLVQEREGGRIKQGNMVVPIDLLPPILDDLLTYGQVNKPPRPWLGLYAGDGDEPGEVIGLAPDGPAAKAGVAVGDVVAEVNGAPIDDLADLFRKVWASGAAGSEVALGVRRSGRAMTVKVRSADRASYLKRPAFH